jgi:hypothetical protein
VVPLSIRSSTAPLLRRFITSPLRFIVSEKISLINKNLFHCRVRFHPLQEKNAFPAASSAVSRIAQRRSESRARPISAARSTHARRFDLSEHFSGASAQHSNASERVSDVSERFSGASERFDDGSRSASATLEAAPRRRSAASATLQSGFDGSSPEPGGTSGAAAGRRWTLSVT